MLRNALFVALAIAAMFPAQRVSAQLWAHGPSQAAPTPTPQPGAISHIVIIVQENRSLDDLFMQFPGATTSTTAHISTGGTQTVTPINLLGGEGFDIGHGHQNWVTECGSFVSGHCMMNGWDLAQTGNSGPPSPPSAMYYVNENSSTCNSVPPCTNLNLYWESAQHNGNLADETFQTNEGPSTTAHFYLAASQSGYPIAFVNQEQKNCALPTLTADSIDMTQSWPGNVSSNHLSGCADTDTIMDLLHAKGLTWKWYYSLGGIQDFWATPTFIAHICQSPGSGNPCTYLNTGGAAIQPETGIFTDLTNHTLANVTWVTPTKNNSDHTQTATQGAGPTWVSSVINAVGNSSYWPNTIVLVVWDDWGGWFDDAPAPHPADRPTDPNEFGFRVPLITISAYQSSPGTVDHTVRDAFGSINRFIETIFTLGISPQCTGTNRSNGAYNPPAPPYFGLCQRDNLPGADNLMNTFNLSASPASFNPIAMTADQRLMAIAGTSDNGASLLLSIDPATRALGSQAMAYAKARGWDSVLARTAPLENDEGEH